MVNKIKTVLLLFLFFVTLFLYYLLEKQKETIEKYEFGTKYLQENVNKKIKIKGNKVNIVYREKEIVKEKTIYVPKEGEIKIIEYLPEKKEDLKIEIKNKGFTLRYGFNILYYEKAYPGIDLKFYYFKQYSAVLFANKAGAGLGVSRHIDDIIHPSFQNIEILLGYNLFKKHFFVGIRSNF